MDQAYISAFLSDPERLMAFAFQERELAEIAESKFKDPICARQLRRGDWRPNDPYIY